MEFLRQATLASVACLRWEYRSKKSGLKENVFVLGEDSPHGLTPERSPRPSESGLRSTKAPRSSRLWRDTVPAQGF